MAIKTPAQAEIRTFNCRGCGGSLKVRSPKLSKMLVCQFCGQTYDLTTPEFEVLAKYDIKTQAPPLIPIGARGTIKGEKWELLGVMRRGITVEGADYEWSEYLLWNPMRGYRYLTEYGGHWIFVKACTGLPKTGQNVARYLDLEFKMFQTAEARVTAVIGEFPWVVSVGDKTAVADYVSPPYVLSMEREKGEVNWSIGEYIEPDDLWAGFELKTSPPARSGVGAVQPSPYVKNSRKMKWLFWSFFLGAFVLQIVSCAMSSNAVVHNESFTYSSTDAEKARVSAVFLLEGRTQSVRIDIATDLQNHWAQIHTALINDETGEVFDSAKGLEYYSGVDDGESWSEGKSSGSLEISGVPSGRWYLRLEPETDAPAINYSVTVRRGVPQTWPMWLAWIFLLCPYLIFLYVRRSFEYKRWLESDYPMSPLVQSSSSQGDESEDEDE